MGWGVDWQVNLAVAKHSLLWWNMWFDLLGSSRGQAWQEEVRVGWHFGWETNNLYTPLPTINTQLASLRLDLRASRVRCHGCFYKSRPQQNGSKQRSGNRNGDWCEQVHVSRQHGSKSQSSLLLSPGKLNNIKTSSWPQFQPLLNETPPRSS